MSSIFFSRLYDNQKSDLQITRFSPSVYRMTLNSYFETVTVSIYIHIGRLFNEFQEIIEIYVEKIVSNVSIS